MIQTKSLTELKTIDTPLYTVADAARYLHVPFGFVFSALGSRINSFPFNFFEKNSFDSRHQIQRADNADFFQFEQATEQITFRSLAALFVVSAIFDPFDCDSPFTRWQSEMESFVNRFRADWQRSVDSPALFSNPEWVLTQFENLLDPFSREERESRIRLIANYQERVEMSHMGPTQLSPLTRETIHDSPRIVVLDPEVRFGRPTVKGVPTDILAERWRAGDQPSELAEDYSLSIEEVDEALRYETRPACTHLFLPMMG